MFKSHKARRRHRHPYRESLRRKVGDKKSGALAGHGPVERVATPARGIATLLLHEPISYRALMLS